MTYRLKFDLLPGEAWFGANINDGWKLPITQETKTVTGTRYISSCNQASRPMAEHEGALSVEREWLSGKME